MPGLVPGGPLRGGELEVAGDASHQWSVKQQQSDQMYKSYSHRNTDILCIFFHYIYITLHIYTSDSFWSVLTDTNGNIIRCLRANTTSVIWLCPNLGCDFNFEWWWSATGLFWNIRILLNQLWEPNCKDYKDSGLSAMACLILYDLVGCDFMGGPGVPTAEREARACAAVVSYQHGDSNQQPRGKTRELWMKKGKAYGAIKVRFQNSHRCGWWRWTNLQDFSGTSGRSHRSSCAAAEEISKDLGCSAYPF